MSGILKKISDLEYKRSRLFEAGGKKQVDRQHQTRKLTARERLEELFDESSFQEINLWVRPIKTGFDIDKKEIPGDGVITGFGKVNNRPVYSYSHDFTVMGGTMSSGHDHKVTRIMEMALEARIPYVGIIDSGGVRIHDLFGRPAFRPMLAGRLGIGGSSCIYGAPALCSGVIPQISLLLGPCYAGSAYSPTMADFTFMRKGTSFMSVASPELLKTVTSADVTRDEIGGAEMHAIVTGTVDYLAETDEEAIEACRALITYLPLNNEEAPPVIDTDDVPNRRENRLLEIVLPDLLKPYNMHEIIQCIIDKDRQFFELQKLFAKSIIIGFAGFNGKTVGIVANNPAEDKGTLSIDTCDKAARFIRWCDAFNVPIVFLVDTPGFSSSIEEEKSGDGLIRTAAKTVFAICEASVPMITVYTGKCFGTGRLAMGTLRMGIDMAYAWPTAQVARMDPSQAVESIYHTEINSSKDSEALRKKRLSELLTNYINHPYHAAELQMVHDIIDPRDTRAVIIRTLEHLRMKKRVPTLYKKHNLIPQ